jgi:hypothetical protein
MAINALRRKLDGERIVVSSLHYASPRPLHPKEIFKRASVMIAGHSARSLRIQGKSYGAS